MRKLLILSTSLLALSVAGLSAHAAPAKAKTAAAAPIAASLASNPAYAAWTGPYGGVPALDKVKVSDFKPALEQGIADYRANIKKITDQKDPATFKNTIEALERSHRALDRAGTLYGLWSSNLSTPAVEAIQEEMEPKIAAVGDEITQNKALFARIKTVYDARDKSGLNAEQKRLVWSYYNDFVRSGALLTDAQKARIAEINQELAGLFTTFNKHQLADESTFITLDSEADLAGLTDDLKAAASRLAEAKGQKGKWIILNTRSSVDPFLANSTRRDLRQKVWTAFIMRGDNDNANNNNATIAKILKLRAERAQILGYKTHAHWRVEDQMAKTPEAAMDLMQKVWGPAVKRVNEEVADMQAIADAEATKGSEKITIEPWDYRFYAEKVRKAKYDLDQNDVKPYLQLDKLREAMFWAAEKNYGFTFKQIHNVPTFDKDQTVYEVRRGGKVIGLWYFDPYARDGKRSGAWMNTYRGQEKMDGPVIGLVTNNSNFVKGAPGEPVLISWDDARTLFHEFGHAINGLASDVTYPSQSSTASARDFVEFPSQINEHWLATPEVLNKFALHYKTGKPLPAELLAKIKASEKFNQGFATVEAVSSALIDMKLHLEGNKDIDPRAFEAKTLAELGMPKQLVMRHRTAQFGHIFSGDGYSAGYYGYLWSDSLTADAWEAFLEGKGAYDADVAKKFYDTILSRGNSVDPADMFKNFRGRSVNVDALMRKRGFIEGKK